MTKEPETERQKLRQYLTETGIAPFYRNIELILSRMEDSIEQAQSKTGQDEDFMDIIHAIFIQGLEPEIIDEEFQRLRHPAARRFYRHYINVVQRQALNHNIRYLVKYFEKKIKAGAEIQYFGTSYVWRDCS